MNVTFCTWLARASGLCVLAGSEAHLPYRLSKAVHDVGGEVKLASVYLRGMGMTGVKLRSIVSSSFEHSRSAAGAMQGNVCHQGVSVARGHTVYN